MRDVLTLPAESFEGFMEFDESPFGGEATGLLQEEIRRGSAEHTRWVQSSLNQVNGERLAVDGIFGPLTWAAVRRFQTRARITVDGIVGPQTEGALMAAGAPPVPGSSGLPSTPTTPTPRPTVVVRKRSASLTSAEQQRYRNVIQRLCDEPGTPNRFARLVQDHAGPHNMHGFNAVGTERFLPWHRVYLLRLEEMMRAVDPLAFIPYWDWTTERRVPAWIASFRPVVRTSGGNLQASRNSGTIAAAEATQTVVNAIMRINEYTRFTDSLEHSPHDDVHVFVGGIMGVIPSAPGDPLFWLHHANVDRIWSVWQNTHRGRGPSLSGANATMQPWRETDRQVDSITRLGYAYGA
jgi:tyrosinase